MIQFVTMCALKILDELGVPEVLVEHIIGGSQEGTIEQKSRNISLQEEIKHILERLYKLDQEDLRYKLVMV